MKPSSLLLTTKLPDAVIKAGRSRIESRAISTAASKKCLICVFAFLWTLDLTCKVVDFGIAGILDPDNSCRSQLQLGLFPSRLNSSTSHDPASG